MKAKPNTEESVCIPREIMLQAAMIRLGEVDQEIQSGYNVLRKYHKTVTMFGSARTEESDFYYQKARELAFSVASHGYTVVTGGGGGIMAAANRGAKEAMGNSIGFNIKLPHEQTLNEFTTESYAFGHFAPRKIVMTMFADAYIYFPGGFGTFDELTEIITLIQTGKTAKAPIILFGSEFWTDFDIFVKNHMLRDHKLIAKEDRTLYMITDDIDEATRHVIENTTYCDHSPLELDQ